MHGTMYTILGEIETTCNIESNNMFFCFANFMCYVSFLLHLVFWACIFMLLMVGIFCGLEIMHFLGGLLCYWFLCVDNDGCRG
jgi:hypothetical protein